MKKIVGTILVMALLLSLTTVALAVGTLPDDTTRIPPMAAPAVAAKILKYNSVQPSYKTENESGNYILDVADFMGPQTLFNGIEKSVLIDGKQASNPAYRQAVLDFLNAQPNMGTTIIMPPDSCF